MVIKIPFVRFSHSSVEGCKFCNLVENSTRPDPTVNNFNPTRQEPDYFEPNPTRPEPDTLQPDSTRHLQRKPEITAYCNHNYNIYFTDLLC